MEFWQLGNTTVRSGMRLKDGVAAFVKAGMTDGGIRGKKAIFVAAMHWAGPESSSSGRIRPIVLAVNGGLPWENWVFFILKLKRNGDFNSLNSE